MHRDAGGDGLLTGGPADDDRDVLGGVAGDATGDALGLVAVTERGDDDEVSGLGEREDAFEGMLEEATAGERHERLRFRVPEPGAAAGGDDDDGEGGRAHATERIRHRC